VKHPEREVTMSSNPFGTGDEPTMDPSALYKEEVFTDRRVGTIHQLTPVRPDGARDLGRPVVFVGEAQLLTSAGALPISFEIEAQTLEEAVAGYPAAAREGFERAVQELQELRRQAASSIVVPDRGIGGLGPGGPGGPAGGGLIKLR
jgi:hypothetical protein